MPFFTGSCGRIHHDAWLPDGRDVERVVVLLHGFGEQLGLYEPLAHRLTADGAAVHAMDAMGHGRSEGERAVLDVDAYVDGARRLADLARDRHPGRPVALIGHSAGGLAAYLLAVRAPCTADALVLSGAPLRPLPWVVDLLAAGGGDDEGFDPTEVLSTHPAYVHALLHDPLVWRGGFPSRTLRSIAAAWPEAGAAISRGLPDLPVLLVHGEEDEVVPVADARASAARLPRARLATFPGDLHDVLNEHDRDAVHDVVADFVLRCAAPAPFPG